MKTFVSSCFNCPLVNNDNEYGLSCNHPDQYEPIEENEMTDRPNVVGVPNRCPLKAGMLMVELMEGVI